MTYHVIHELYAGSANLKSIRKQCLSGRLATLEISEMLENLNLAQISPEDTRLETVNLNRSEKELEFTYWTRKMIEVDEKIMLYALVLFVLIIKVIMYNMKIIKQLNVVNQLYNASNRASAVSRFRDELSFA